VNRQDVYTAVHKMQRARLFALIVQAGKADPASPAARARLAAAAEAVIAELLAHAEHEDRFIHPLLRGKAPALARELDAAHSALDARLKDLRQAASAYASSPADPNRLYRALTGFTAAYLEHLAAEEDKALPALWDSCTDQELAGILTSFKASRSDTENLTSLLAQLPTLNPPEISTMAAAGLTTVPLTDITEILATILEPGQLGALHLSPVPQPADA
jgi:iron-sulfur cluster repair protein YtfE (RIC family)